MKVTNKLILTEYLCHGQWQENTTTFIVAKHVGSSHGVCITFRQNADGQTGNLVVGDSCYRNTISQMSPSDRHIVANLTSFGKNQLFIFIQSIRKPNKTFSTSRYMF